MSRTTTNHQLFLETFFEEEKYKDVVSYAEREINGWWLIRHWDGNKNAFTIHVYCPESYRKYVRVKTQFHEREEQINFLRSVSEFRGLFTECDHGQPCIYRCFTVLERFVDRLSNF